MQTMFLHKQRRNNPALLEQDKYVKAALIRLSTDLPPK